MAKLLSFAAAAALLVSSTLAHEGHSEGSEALPTTECAANITTAALAVIDNSTYLNTCSPGSTWKLTNLFEAANLSATDFLTFCNSTECMHPMHELGESLSDDCVSTYNGAKVVLADKVDVIHDKCHDVLNKKKAGSSHDDDHDDHKATAGSKSNSSASATTPATVPAPASTTSSASVSSKSLAALISVTVTLAAFVL